MEAIEESMLREREFDTAGSLQKWFEQRFDSKSSAEDLIKVLNPKEFEDGEVICRQGDHSDEIYFLDRGRVDVVSHEIWPTFPYLLICATPCWVKWALSAMRIGARTSSREALPLFIHFREKFIINWKKSVIQPLMPCFSWCL